MDACAAMHVNKKYKSQIETLQKRKGHKISKSSNKKKMKLKNKIEWSHILLKDKQVRLAKLITKKKAKTKYATKRIKDKFEEKYKPRDHHIIYEKICAKYKENPLPVYLGPLMLHFEDQNRTKCMLYYGNRTVFLIWVQKRFSTVSQ
eukprot:266207_1